MDSELHDPTSQTIVVGYDASRESLSALHWARSVAGPEGRIIVTNVWDIPIVVGQDTVVTDLEEIETYARDALDALLDGEEDPRLEPVIGRGHAGRALVDAGADADLIVVGHRGHGRMSMMLGSTANYVIHHTDRPVVITRDDDVAGPPRKVVVGVDAFDADEDHPSVRAVRWAYGLPGVEQVIAVHGWYLPPPSPGMYHDATWDSTRMDAGALQLAEAVVAAAGEAPAGVDVSAESARGRGAAVLVDASESADLVVVGRRGRGGFAELLLGSTSAALAAHGHSPIAIVQ